jgi:hypothetical protein
LGAKILGAKTALVGHDATSIFLYLHHAVKGAQTKGQQDDRLGIRRPFAGATEPGK